MRAFRTSLRLAALVGAGVLWAFAPGVATRTAAAATTTWTGGAGSGSWSDAGNWSTQPLTTGTWGLVFGGNTQVTSTNTIGTITVDAISFTNNGATGQAATFTLSGAPLAFANATVTTSATTGGAMSSPDGDILAGPLSLVGSNAFNLGVGHNLTVTGGISGGGSAVVNGSNGSGWLYLTGSNSYSGGTTVNSGVLQNGLRTSFTDFNSNAFGTGAITVNGGGTVAIRNNSTITNNFTIAGTGATNGSGSLGALRGSFGTSDQTATVSGTVALSANATIVTAASSGVTGSELVLSGPVSLGSNALTLAAGLAIGGTSASSAAPIEITGPVSGAGSVVVATDPLSRVLLAGNNNYSGGTSINAGTLRVGSATAVGTGAVAVNAGTLDLNGQSLLLGTLSGSSGGLITSSVVGPASLTTSVAANSTYAGTIQDGSGVVGLVKTGTCGLYLTGSNSYSGGTTVTGGILQNGLRSSFTDFNSNAFGTGAITVSGSGTVAIRNNSSITNNFTIAGTGATNGSGSLGALRGSFGTSDQTATASGTVTLSGNATIATGASSGVTGSKLVLSGPVSLGSNVLTLAAGLAIGGTSASSAAPIEISGPIGGTGSVVIASNPFSRVLLSGSSSYSGGTTVSAGTLRVGSSNAVGVGRLTVNNGGILDVNGQSLSVGSLQLNSGGIVQMGISGTDAGLFAQIVSAGQVVFGGTLQLTFDRSGFATGDLWQLFSGSSFDGSFSLIKASGAYGDLVFQNIGDGEWKADIGNGQTMSFYENDTHAFNGRFMAGQLVVVPEPSTLVIVGIGGAVVSGWHSLRRRRAARKVAREGGRGRDSVASQVPAGMAPTA